MRKERKSKPHIMRRNPSLLFAKFLSWLIIWFTLLPANAEDISLHLAVAARDNIVTVTVTNEGRDSTKNLEIELELDSRVYRKQLTKILPPKSSETTSFQVRLPQVPGTYPLYTTVLYTNDNTTLSIQDVGQFHYQKKQALHGTLELSDLKLRETGNLKVNFDKSRRFRLTLPREIQITSIEETNTGRVYRLKNTVPQFRSNYAIFGVLENSPHIPLHATKIIQARLITVPARTVETFPFTRHLGFTALFFLILAYVFLHKKNLLRTPLFYSLTRWAFSIFMVSALLFTFQTAHVVPDFLLEVESVNRTIRTTLPQILYVPFRALLETLYFEGPNYEAFRQFFIAPLFLYVLLGNFFVLYFLVRPHPRTDKYWHLMLAFFGKRKSKEFSPCLCKTATSTMLVKIFFVPLLCSWTVNNIEHQQNLLSNFQWSFAHINIFLVALFILIDVTIFALGYLVELPQLRNQIRSVEPTLLGWIVCLICYPPFNQFSFTFFDKPLSEYWQPASEQTQMLTTGLITLLWTVYLSATIALGARASNLTNRGIVSSGPYRYVRHPAYVSKIGLWVLSGIFLGEKNFYLVLTLIAIYFLRGFTEERHLSKDPDYVAYKKDVRWKVFPGVW